MSLTIRYLIVDAVKLNGNSKPAQELVEWIASEFASISRQQIAGNISWACDSRSGTGLWYNNGTVFI